MLDADGLIPDALQGDAETQQGAIAFELLRADIVSCRLAPGSNVSEAELAARHGLGKAAIRRALVRLSERGWVQALARRGYLVKPITLRDIGEIFALRRMVEPVAVRHAVGRADVNRLRQLDAVCGAGFGSDPASQATFLQAHRQLHLSIVTAGGNERLTDVFTPLWDESERLMHHAGLLRSRGAALRHDHAALIAALATARADEAATTIEDEIERLHRTVVDVALATPSMLAPAAQDAGAPIREWRADGSRKTGRQGRAIEQ